MTREVRGLCVSVLRSMTDFRCTSSAFAHPGCDGSKGEEKSNKRATPNQPPCRILPRLLRGTDRYTRGRDAWGVVWCDVFERESPLVSNQHCCSLIRSYQSQDWYTGFWLSKRLYGLAPLSPVNVHLRCADARAHGARGGTCNKLHLCPLQLNYRTSGAVFIVTAAAASSCLTAIAPTGPAAQHLVIYIVRCWMGRYKNAGALKHESRPKEESQLPTSLR